jgi:hypothetical protein
VTTLVTTQGPTACASLQTEQRAAATGRAHTLKVLDDEVQLLVVGPHGFEVMQHRRAQLPRLPQVSLSYQRATPIPLLQQGLRGGIAGSHGRPWQLLKRAFKRSRGCVTSERAVAAVGSLPRERVLLLRGILRGGVGRQGGGAEGRVGVPGG